MAGPGGPTFGSAIPITLGDTSAHTDVGGDATPPENPVPEAGESSTAAWWVFTADQTRWIAFNGNHSQARSGVDLQNLVVTVYTGTSFGTSIQVGSDGGYESGGGPADVKVPFHVQSGVTYHVSVDTNVPDDISYYVLSVDRPPDIGDPPPNDDVDNASQIWGGNDIPPVDMSGATLEGGNDSDNLTTTGRSVWWMTTPTYTGQAVFSLDVTNTTGFGGWDGSAPDLAIFSGAMERLFGGDYQNYRQIDVVAGETYYLRASLEGDTEYGIAQLYYIAYNDTPEVSDWIQPGDQTILPTTTERQDGLGNTLDEPTAQALNRTSSHSVGPDLGHDLPLDHGTFNTNFSQAMQHGSHADNPEPWWGGIGVDNDPQPDLQAPVVAYGAMLFGGFYLANTAYYFAINHRVTAVFNMLAYRKYQAPVGQYVDVEYADNHRWTFLAAKMMDFKYVNYMYDTTIEQDSLNGNWVSKLQWYPNFIFNQNGSVISANYSGPIDIMTIPKPSSYPRNEGGYAIPIQVGDVDLSSYVNQTDPHVAQLAIGWVVEFTDYPSCAGDINSNDGLACGASGYMDVRYLVRPPKYRTVAHNYSTFVEDPNAGQPSSFDTGIRRNLVINPSAEQSYDRAWVGSSGTVETEVKWET